MGDLQQIAVTQREAGRYSRPIDLDCTRPHIVENPVMVLKPNQRCGNLWDIRISALAMLVVTDEQDALCSRVILIARKFIHQLQHTGSNQRKDCFEQFLVALVAPMTIRRYHIEPDFHRASNHRKFDRNPWLVRKRILFWPKVSIVSFATHLQQLCRILIHTETLREDQVRVAKLAKSLAEFLDLLQAQRAWWNPEAPAINDFQRQRIAAAEMRGLRDLDRELRVNNFLILGELGAGGMGIVHKAWSVEFEQFTAIKRLLYNNADHRDRLERESKILRVLNDPLIAQYIAFEPIEDGGGFLLAMEYVAGTSLQEYLQRHPFVDEPTTVNWAVAILKALSHTHSRNVVHRDVTPRNIMIISKSGDIPLKLLDFGLGKIVGSLSHVLQLPEDNVVLTQMGCGFGTPRYMSPEQFSDAASVTAASDLYSLGCVLFEMLTGQPPFPIPNNQYPALLTAHTHRRPPDIRSFRSDISEPLSFVIMRMLEKDPGKRQSASEFAELLTGRKKVRQVVNVQIGESDSADTGTQGTGSAAFADSRDEVKLKPVVRPARSDRDSQKASIDNLGDVALSTSLHPNVQWFRYLIPQAPLTAASGHIDSEVTLPDIYLAYTRIRKWLILGGLGLLMWLVFQSL